MKASDSREHLITKIENLVLNSSPDKINKIEEEVRHDGKISLGSFLRIVSGRADLDELSDAELYWLTFAISKVSKNFGVPEDYFEDVEIQNYKYYDPQTDNNKKIGYPLVFRNVSKLADNQYMFPLSVREIKELKSANLLQIIPELQRNHKKDKYGDLKTKVNRQTAQQISNLINEEVFL